jgi:hypothetical protein
MNLEGIRQAVRRRPFVPFSVMLADGRALDVPHPEFVAVGTRLATVIAEDGSWSVVEPLLIVSLDSLPRRNGKGNGSGK